LGNIYYYGKDVKQNYVEAVEWYQKAIEDDIFWACCEGKEDSYLPYNLGICYYYGRGVEKNLDKAAKYFGWAANMGNNDAQNKLKEILKSTAR
jgi:TPR repeat protein